MLGPGPYKYAVRFTYKGKEYRQTFQSYACVDPDWHPLLVWQVVEPEIEFKLNQLGVKMEDAFPEGTYPDTVILEGLSDFLYYILPDLTEPQYNPNCSIEDLFPGIND